MKSATIICAVITVGTASAFSTLGLSSLTHTARVSSTAVNAFWDKKPVAEPVVEEPAPKKGGFSFGAKKAAKTVAVVEEPAPKKAPFSFLAKPAKPVVAEKPVKKGIEAKKKDNAKKRIATTVFDLDLFKPYAARNDYGQRKNKNVKIGKITNKSYIPAGLTQQQYADLRKAEKAKKDQNYARNVAKGGKFQDYTDFYIARGTDTDDKWKKSVTLGHTMAKTKYDWGAQDLSIKNFASEDKTKRKRRKSKSF